MSSLFSPLYRAKVWRAIWIALAKAEHALGAPIKEEQLEALERTRDIIDLARVDIIERECKHDVVAHIRAWSEVAGAGAPIIHLGATSALVTDNADLIIQRDALLIVRTRLVQLLRALVKRALEFSSLPMVGYTHFQPAQPVTLGKRISMWIQDLVMDLHELHRFLENMEMLGVKGATGTQATFLEMFNGDLDKVRQLDETFCEHFNMFPIPIAGQTYTRKIDVKIADIIAGLGISLHKLGTDLRLLAHTQEVREEFGVKQVGSSAMPYKRNPMQAERLCALARLAKGYRDTIAESAAIQWFERTLDDSATRRVAIPDQFMAIDGALRVAIGLVGKFTPNREIISALMDNEFRNAVTEKIIVQAVAAGYDRGVVHEALRNAADWNNPDAWVMDSKLDNIISQVIKTTSHNDLVGMASEQAEDFLAKVDLMLGEYHDVPEFEDSVQK